MTHLPWVWDVWLNGRPHIFGNIAPAVPNAKGVDGFWSWIRGSMDTTLTWSHIDWIRENYRGKIILKGVQDVEDARQAVRSGFEGIVVSNHGGRQLDGVAPSLEALPEVVAAVGKRVEVLLDGGIRRGSDVVKALCLGARAVLIGRAYAYGLGAAGEAGVTRALEILRADLLRTLKLLGCGAVAELDPSYVELPSSWRGARPALPVET